jgi:hypothetical protein
MGEVSEVSEVRSCEGRDKDFVGAALTRLPRYGEVR